MLAQIEIVIRKTLPPPPQALRVYWPEVKITTHVQANMEACSHLIVLIIKGPTGNVTGRATIKMMLP
jgi:hypothetical protein